MWSFAFLIFVVIAAMMISWLHPKFRLLRKQEAEIRKHEAEIFAREPLPDDEMFARYFQSDEVAPHVPKVVRRVLARALDFTAEKILPDDDLTPFLVEVEAIYWIEELETFFGVSLTDEDDEETICSIRSVSRLVSQKLAE